MTTEDSTSPQEAVLQFDLQQEIAEANDHKPWASGIYSKMLLKRSDVRLVLTLLDTDAGIKEHHADGSVSVHVLRGKLTMRAQDKEHQLAEGDLLNLPPAVRHDVRALEPSAFLLTISWPDSEKLKSMSHRGYGS